MTSNEVDASSLQADGVAECYLCFGGDEFTKPWRVCPGCHQEYQNEFAVDIASAFVTFNRSQYPRDTHKQGKLLI